jgi:hypothetical protein
MIQETRRVKRQDMGVVFMGLMVTFVLASTTGLAQTISSGTYRVDTVAEDGQRYSSTWRLWVEGNRIKGESDWDCCPGRRTDPLKGRIEQGRVIIERECSGQGLRDHCYQVYAGVAQGNVIEGSFTYNGTHGGHWTLYVWGSDSDRDWYDRDRGNHRRGGRHPISEEAVRKAIAKLEDLSDEIEKDIEKLTKKGRRDPITRQLEAELQAFENVCDELEKEFKRGGKDPWAVEAEVRSVLDRGRRIDDLIYRSNITGEVRQDWAEIRVRLDLLADAYGLRRIG